MLPAGIVHIECRMCGTLVGVHLGGVCFECWDWMRKKKREAESMDWFRMYTEARNDAKLRSLTDSQHRIWFNLLCFASEQPERGIIEGYDTELLAVEVAGGDTDLLTETIQRLWNWEAPESVTKLIEWE